MVKVERVAETWSFRSAAFNRAFFNEPRTYKSAGPYLLHRLSVFPSPRAADLQNKSALVS